MHNMIRASHLRARRGLGTLALAALLAGCVMPIAAPVPITPPVPVTEESAATAESSTTISGVTIYGGDEATLREFLRQTMLSPFAEEGASTTVYIGTLPPALPITLTLPAEVGIVGAIVSEGMQNSTQLLFTHEGEVGASVDDLRQQLEAQGYTRLATNAGNEVFQTQSADYTPLCNPDGDQSILLNGRNLDDGTGIIRVYINEAQTFSGPCGVPTSGGTSPYADMMPTLTAPPNVRTYSSGSGSGGDNIEASIGFVGEITIAELTAHYHPQLIEHGWQQLGASETEEMAWSGWSVPHDDETYTATFYIVREAGNTNRFEAVLRVSLR